MHRDGASDDLFRELDIVIHALQEARKMPRRNRPEPRARLLRVCNSCHWSHREREKKMRPTTPRRHEDTENFFSNPSAAKQHWRFRKICSVPSCLRGAFGQRLSTRLEDDALEACFQDRLVEVHEQAHTGTGYSQVGEDLRLEYGSQ